MVLNLKRKPVVACNGDYDGYCRRRLNYTYVVRTPYESYTKMFWHFSTHSTFLFVFGMSACRRFSMATAIDCSIYILTFAGEKVTHDKRPFRAMQRKPLCTELKCLRILFLHRTVAFRRGQKKWFIQWIQRLMWVPGAISDRRNPGGFRVVAVAMPRVVNYCGRISHSVPEKKTDAIHFHSAGVPLPSHIPALAFSSGLFCNGQHRHSFSLITKTEYMQVVPLCRTHRFPINLLLATRQPFCEPTENKFCAQND